MCKKLSEHDAEFLENYASNLIDDMVSKLLINQPENPLDFIVCKHHGVYNHTSFLNLSILNPENNIAFEELVSELGGVSHQSSSFTLKCKTIYDKVYRIAIKEPDEEIHIVAPKIFAIAKVLNQITPLSNQKVTKVHDLPAELSAGKVQHPSYTSAQNSQCVGEVISAFVRDLTRKAFDSERFLSHFKLERCEYMSFSNFRKLLKTTLIFRDFTMLCSKLFHNPHAPLIDVVRLVEDITRNSEYELPEIAECLPSLRSEEQNSIKYEEFMKNCIELFISQLL
ncbi:hypothetical protein AHF37_00165 [Paragonimus kellicotti]|nr:hypothetical protein AHF37_00165 [Paragonimus kellicotti]